MATKTRTSSPAAAVSTFLAYPQTLASISEKAQGVTIGRWTITVNCRYGSFLLDNVDTTSFEFALDFPQTRQVIYRLRDDIEDEFEGKWPTIAAVQKWIKTEIPKTNTALQQVVADRRGPLKDVLRNLGKVQRLADQAHSTLADASTTLLDLAQAQTAHIAAVEDLQTPIMAEVHERMTELQQFLQNQPCGRDDALRQFAYFQTELTGSNRALTAAASHLRHETQLVGQAASVLATSAAALSTDTARMIAMATKGGEDSIGHLYKTMEISSRANEWKNLEAAATKTLNAEPLSSPLRRPSLRKRASARRD